MARRWTEAGAGLTLFIAYTLDGVRDPAAAADHLSVQWRAGFQLGVAASGPLGRGEAGSRGHAGAPPHALVDNEHSIFTR